MSIEQGITQIQAAITIKQMTKGLDVVNNCPDAEFEDMSSSEINGLKRLIQRKARQVDGGRDERTL